MLAPISETEIREIYWLDLAMLGPELQAIDNEATTVDFNHYSTSDDGAKTLYLVNIFALNKEPVLDKKLERWLCDNRVLLGRPGIRGRVAIRVNFFVRSKYQQNGLATHINSREQPVFRRWGAAEIHLFAMEMGRWVWTRPQFGYQIDEFEFFSLQQKYKEWQLARGVSPVLRAGELGDFPRDFLLSQVDSLSLYQTL